MQAEPAENVLFRFEVDTKDGTHVVDGWVSAAAMGEALENPKSFDNMMEGVCEKLGIEFRDSLDRRSLMGLPLINNHPLSGRWICASPMGLENTEPAPAWEFKARVQHALITPELFPMAQGKLRNPFLRENGSNALDEYRSLVKRALEGQFGSKAVASVESQAVRTWLDDAMGGMSM